MSKREEPPLERVIGDEVSSEENQFSVERNQQIKVTHIQEEIEDKWDYANDQLRAPEQAMCWGGVRDGNNKMNI